ncbi:MAG: TIGR03560 family F420-dependent LLM class oxidoreductase [Caldilineaceae bacterium]
MDIAIMVEGQDGLTWPIWQAIARKVEALGFAGLYRSDHFTNAEPPDEASLELWVSLTWLASHTERIEFGPMVTPFSFRSPLFTARMGKDVNDLSGGRLVLGIGAGWQEREHTMFGFPLLEAAPRMARFAEGVEITHRLLRDAEPVDFAGSWYTLQGAHLLPPPQVPGGPRILIGGNGEKRTLPLVARWADEWNAVFLPADRIAALNLRLDTLLAEQGRPPSAVRRSLMTGLVFGRTPDELRDKLRGRPADDLRAHGVLVATPDTLHDLLEPLAAAGVQRVMLQWLELDNLEGLDLLAAALGLERAKATKPRRQVIHPSND